MLRPPEIPVAFVESDRTQRRTRMVSWRGLRISGAQNEEDKQGKEASHAGGREAAGGCNDGFGRLGKGWHIYSSGGLSHGERQVKSYSPK